MSAEHITEQHYQHETHVEGGWGNQAPGSDTMRIFFGRTRHCRCADCKKRDEDETWAHMQARGLVPKESSDGA